ncbi:MAG TPA: hypothetical protein VMB05_05775 [Solirubrobacteraceae bacterium]|nr:hypothetical protein [Solirubrobacteraceae bacterium]
MRSLPLETSLTEFFTEAGAYLRAELATGAEVPFEVGAQRSRRVGAASTLYCYRALTGEFIAEREPALRRLPAYGVAARLLEHFDGLDHYLASLGADSPRTKGRSRVHVALKALLDEVFEEQSEFELQNERVDRALERLQGAARADAGELALVTELRGVTIASQELPLTKGLRIIERDALPELPLGASAVSEDELSERPLVVLYTSEPDDPAEGLRDGRAVLKDLLSSLRLFGDGRVALGPLAWARVGSGPWVPLVLGGAGRPRGMLVVTAEQEDELRAFCNLVSRRAPHDNDLAWALRRFELACERESPFEGLSDNLLALRALLEPEGPASGRLAGRIAALCATAEQRGELTARMTRAIALERSLIAGTAPKNAASQSLVEDVAGHLRSLLRDVICGHLEPDLAVIADELLEPDELLHVDEDREAESVDGESVDGESVELPLAAVSAEDEISATSAVPAVLPVVPPADILGRGELRARRVRETPLQSRTLASVADPAQEPESFEESDFLDAEFVGAEELAAELDLAEHDVADRDAAELEAVERDPAELGELTDGVHAADSFGELGAEPEQPELPIDGVVSTFS